jgi:3-oxoacyl-[acyl-carrier protein] reductase
MLLRLRPRPRLGISVLGVDHDIQAEGSYYCRLVVRSVTWIVTGGASGIGASIAEDARDRGESVLVWDKVLPSQALAGVDYEPVDLLDSDAIRAASDRVRSRVMAFVHCAGVSERTAFSDRSAPEAMRFAFELHAVSLVVAIQALRGRFGVGSSIIAVTSAASEIVYPGSLAYGTSKAALQRVVEQLAVELAPVGVRVNAVAPGGIETPMTQHLWADPDRSARRQGLIPMGRQGQPAEVALAVRYLCSSDAGYVTGHTLWVDGGARVGMYSQEVGSFAAERNQEVQNP